MIYATRTGVGIHTGQPCTATLEALPPGSGIVFDTPQGRIQAQAENVTETLRCTVLGSGEARLSTVEHLLSACAGYGIRDLKVTVDGPELPILDGSAAGWAQVLPQSPLYLREIPEPLIVTGKGGAFIACYPAETLTVTCAIAFEHPLVGTQVARWEGDAYLEEIAPARTFGFIEEVQKLLDAGLAKGGSLDNAVIVHQDRYEPSLRFDNELARHKLLDLLGDIWLAGFLPKADIIAMKPSHGLNCRLASLLSRIDFE
ncbi:UDP-3-O-acyl-N-acetylglucosamine deacetylase [Armatimonas sp.]|uniref:UDP-3-O-acyl-N-acetylglucosamine deacetylase n=1 Tax=Armatimonas sp. TaxID=1872638 RepID=UPI00286A9E03|nr:UDP-3-O-acyl-N-acetylglucosamine deacetylase [Armatimonas sp.]